MTSAPFLGVLMLQTRFPRPLGDVGHAGSFAMPVRHLVVAGATPRRVVQRADAALIQPFIDAGRALVAEGAAALTTSCGFLARWQPELQAALPVPVWTSSLLALPGLRAQRPGVVTVDAGSLESAVLAAAGVDFAVPIQGLDPASALVDTLLNDRATLDRDWAEHTTVQAARQLCAREPGIGTLVLECTNLPPYAEAVRRATGRPVQHLLTLVHARWAGLKLRASH